jgi:hypothetical protein
MMKTRGVVMVEAFYCLFGGVVRGRKAGLVVDGGALSLGDWIGIELGILRGSVDAIN